VVRSAVVADSVAVADVAGATERLERTVSQRWLEIGWNGAVVAVVEIVGWVACCEGRGGGDAEQREVGRKGFVVVEGT